MADSKLSALSAAGAYDDADLLYIVQGGVSYKTTWGGLKAAVLSAVTLYPEVANYAALPAAASHTGEVYLVLAAQGTRWLFTLKDAGLYVSDGADWDYVGPIPANYFTDSVMEIADDSDPTKICKFQLSSITTATTRTLTVPDASGTIMLVGNAPTAHAASHASGGSDAVKLDDLAAPDDNTDRDATTSLHGLMPKLDKVKLDGISAHSGKKVLLVEIGDGTNVITTGTKGYGRSPWAGTITKATVLETSATPVAGSIVLDVWKDTYANWPPANGDSITASAKPTLSTASKSEDATLTGWTTSVAAGDTFGFEVESITSCKRVLLLIEVTLT